MAYVRVDARRRTTPWGYGRPAPPAVSFIPPFQISVAYAGLGESAEVFAWLNRAVAERDWQLWQLGTHPAFRPYHTTLAFQALLRKVRYPLAE